MRKLLMVVAGLLAVVVSSVCNAGFGISGCPALAAAVARQQKAWDYTVAVSTCTVKPKGYIRVTVSGTNIYFVQPWMTSGCSGVPTGGQSGGGGESVSCDSAICQAGHTYTSARWGLLSAGTAVNGCFDGCTVQGSVTRSIPGDPNCIFGYCAAPVSYSKVTTTGSLCGQTLPVAPQLNPLPPNPPPACSGVTCYDPSKDQACISTTGGQACITISQGLGPGGGCGTGGGAALCGGVGPGGTPAPPSPPIDDPTGEGVGNVTIGATDGSGSGHSITLNGYFNGNPATGGGSGGSSGGGSALSGGPGGDPTGGTAGPAPSQGDGNGGQDGSGLGDGQVCLGGTVNDVITDSSGATTYKQVLYKDANAAFRPVPCNQPDSKDSACPEGNVPTASGCAGSFQDVPCNSPTPPPCSGDAVLCGITNETWRTRCAVEKQSPASSSTAGLYSKSPWDTSGDPSPGQVENQVDAGDTSGLDSGGFGYGTTCPAEDATYTVGGSSFVIPFSKACLVGGWLRAFILAFAYFGAAKIAAGLKGE